MVAEGVGDAFDDLSGFMTFTGDNQKVASLKIMNGGFDSLGAVADIKPARASVSAQNIPAGPKPAITGLACSGFRPRVTWGRAVSR